MTYRHAIFPALALLPLFSGCKVGPDYEPPAPEVPAAFAAPATPADAAVLGRWWSSLGDTHLTALIDRALAMNLDLAAATARLRQSRGRSDGAYSQLAPSVGASAGQSFSHDPNNRDHLSSATSSYRAGLDAVWELDFFGGNRRALESAEAGANAALENRRALRVSVAGEVALNYAAWITARKQKRYALGNVESSEQLLKLVKLRRDTGSASELDFVNAQTDLLSARSAIPAYESDEARAVNALAVLLAVEPAVMAKELSGFEADIALKLPEVAAGMPSELLRRRPDIREAEQSLHAATAGIGAATADYFPKFSLTGSLGISANANASSPGLAWSAGPSISWNPFQGGAVSANVEVQKALRDESTLTYRKTVLAAFAEVETALVTTAKESERRVILRDVLEGQRKSVALTTALYEQGQVDLYTLILTRRQLYGAQSSLAGSDNAAFTALVALYKSLGGGWSEADAEEIAASPVK